ncbi:type VI secretion system lipoprotein TssJ [Pseudomonas wadenswilerensis]
MKHVVALLLATSILAGCSTVGNVFTKTGQVLMNPSVQVGAADDQPSQLALSLYASPDVNPNPVSCAAAAFMDSTGSAAPGLNAEGHLAINLRGTSRDELIGQLRGLLDRFEHDPERAFGALAVRQRLAIPGLVVDDQAPPLTLGKSQPEALFSDTATSRWPSPSNWLLRQGQRSSAGGDEPQGLPGGSPDLGQYARGPALNPAADLRRASGSATPIGFRVLQLKDDSMLENADPEVLHKTPKKALGSTLLSSDDYILMPGQFKFVEFADVDEKARYIAVVADFHDPGAERWHDVFRIEPRGRTYPLLVMLQGSRVAITDERYRPAPGHACASPHASTYP